MNGFGIAENSLRLIRRYLATHPQITAVQIYGSRARGDYRNGSDIDLAIWGVTDWDAASKIKAALYHLPTPYKFDVVAYEMLDSEELKEVIASQGKEFAITTEGELYATV